MSGVMNGVAVPEPGQLVHVRHRWYTVSDVKPATMAGGAGQHLVRMSSIEDDGHGEELQVIWEIEPGALARERLGLPQPSAFDTPIRMDAFLDAVRWGTVSTADTRAIQSPFRSGIQIEEYQLDPVVRAVQMPRVSLLIADDVGLGKTIEAGLVMLELMLRQRASRMLVVCPASLQIQWRDQMREKFGLEFRIVDSDLLRELRRTRGLHANPWTHFPRLITSIDFLKREYPMRLFQETLPQAGQSHYPRRFDVLVVDEAHNIAPSGRGHYAIDSQRTSAIRDLSPHFEHRIFLSATPHNGYQESFSSLLELLDNQRFARAAPLERNQIAAVMVRRMKSEFKEWDGGARFPIRELEPLEVEYAAEERAIHHDLQTYRDLRRKRAEEGASRLATEFVIKLLKKRIFSSPAAFASTLDAHLRSLSRPGGLSKPSDRALQREFEQMDDEFPDDTEFEEAATDALEAAARALPGASPEETALLQKMADWARTAKERPDAKAATLVHWLKENICPHGRWSDQRVIIFTEYRATQNWLLGILASHGMAGDQRLLMLHGGMNSEERETVKAAFQFDPRRSPVRILLATDSASEGIDLQNYCSRLIHYEIPWNPNRMEQRNGRVDRHGQREKKVFIYHFVGKGYRRETVDPHRPGDLEGDLEFLARAALKVNTIREDLGKVGPVIAQQVEEAMLGRRSRLETEAAERESEPVRRLLRVERDLREQVSRLADKLKQSQKDLHVSAESVRHVVETALELAAQPPLIPVQVRRADGSVIPAFQLPPFKGSWAHCSEGLEHPHTHEIRPIVFDHHLATGQDDVVLAHLNHRLVQMSMRLLRAEVWSTEEGGSVHRATARLTSDTALEAPALVAHARLVLVGKDGQRLHEELIAAGGILRSGRFNRLNVTAIDEALAASGHETPSQEVQQRLLELLPRHSASLLQSLDARMRDRVAGLSKALQERAEQEMRHMRTNLEELRRSILAELDRPEDAQLSLFSDPEREQWRKNQQALRQRAQQIPDELERELELIRNRFADPQPRLFPVAITCLVPRRFAHAAGEGL